MNNTTDVNQASCDDLLMLPGITLAQAKRIMSYIEKHKRRISRLSSIHWRAAAILRQD